jgi:hypothetical protein
MMRAANAIDMSAARMVCAVQCLHACQHRTFVLEHFSPDRSTSCQEVLHR